MNTYQTQDRGSQKDYKQYLEAMDAVSVEKVASASAFYDPSPGNAIVDVGMASGTSSNILALLFPYVKIIGVDINPKMVEIAAQMYQLPNLEFRVDDGEKLNSFKENTVNGFFNCSSIHHITSFNGYDHYRAYSTIKRQSEILKQGGIIVIRDFVKPTEMEVILDLSDKALPSKPSDAELLVLFSQQARSLATPNEKGFPVRELSCTQKGTRRFCLYFADAVEFIRRKDYFSNWEIELQEEYGYFTQKEFEEIFASLGLRIIVSNPVFNPWIISNRYRGKFTLYNKNMEDIGFPPTNYLIAGEKTDGKGTKINIIRHLPEANQPFLRYSNYCDATTQKIYDVVQRPNSVADIIPYYKQNNSLEILAKHGYPRPLVNIETDSPVIDQKHFSGYITEGITASFSHSIESILAFKAGLSASAIGQTQKALEYYPSPGGIEEKVDSFLVELKEQPQKETINSDTHSGFANAGTIRKFDAIQLLKTSQTGALIEARLELNLYNLLRKLDMPFPQWLGEKIEVHSLAVTPCSLSEALRETSVQFVKTSESAGYLEKYRAKFAENTIGESNNILEYVTPTKVSCNTLITLPIAEYKGKIYIGLEPRNLPVPQALSGNSFILVAPACRLPKEISSFKDLENYMLKIKFFDTSITHFNKLGEKFFPSAGITPEQAYPYVVSLAEPASKLKWVSLTEIYDNIELIRDGHLLISIVRLMNALM
jgi:SAM-dependent methyltransferase